MSDQAYTGGSPDIYERDGRRFVKSGIGTIGWGVYDLYREIDANGNPLDQVGWPLEFRFPDPAVVAAQQQRNDEERARLERAAQFPVEGMSGEYRDDLKGLYVWRTDQPDDDYMHLWIDKCGFCGEEKYTVSVVAGYDSLEVCRACLGKMFDAFEAHELSK